jgi:isopenicillin-N epimerase
MGGEIVARSLPPYGPLAEHFLVDRGRVFLNHGSFGGTPIVVMEAQEKLRRRVEADTVEWFVESAGPLMEAARRRIARLVDADDEGLMLIPNATAGVSNVVRNLQLRSGDELLTGTHEYNACSNALRWAAERECARGVDVRVVTTALPCPMQSDDEVVAAIVGGITARTRLLLLSHITSPSGLILPALRIVREGVARARELGNERFEVVVDGAHAPGYMELSVREFLRAGAAYYTGNLHKWTCGPKGTAFLAVGEKQRGAFAPLIISHGFNSAVPGRTRFRQMADFVGSVDYTGFMVMPMCLDVLGGFVPGDGGGDGLGGVRGLQNDLRAQAVAILGDRLGGLGGGRTIGPGHALGAMAAITLPGGSVPTVLDPLRPFDPIHYRLREKWKIQVPAYWLAKTDGTRQRVLRLTAAVYNTVEQFEYLAEALVSELKGESGG